MKNDFDNLEITDLFKISSEERVRLIELGVDNVILNCQKLSRATGIKTSKLLSDTLARFEMRTKEMAEGEEYELSYYFNELIWGVHRRINALKEQEGED